MNFVLISDVKQKLKESLFGPNWVHFATAKIPGSNISKERYFMALKNLNTGKIYIEEYVDAPYFFVKIEEDKLWQDLYMFFIDKKVLTIGVGQEFKVEKKD